MINEFVEITKGSFNHQVSDAMKRRFENLVYGWTENQGKEFVFVFYLSMSR